MKYRSLVQIKSHGQKMVKKLEAGEDIFAPLKLSPLECTNNNGRLTNFLSATKEKDTIIAVEALSLLSQGSNKKHKAS